MACQVMASAQDSPLTPDDARAIARDAYIYGFPLVDNARIMYAYFVDRHNPEFKAPWNVIYNNARVYTPADTAIQSPNSDTPYSNLGADLRAEPLVLGFPAVAADRYFSAQFIDLYTYNFAYVGSRATGNGGGYFLLAGPDWHGEQPAEITAIIRCETQLAMVLYRTQLFAPDDIAAVEQIQAGYTVQPLSAFLGQPAPPAPPVIDFPQPLTVEEERTSLRFFGHLNFVLRFCPTHPSEVALMRRFARIGVRAGAPFALEALAPDIRQAIQDGMTAAWEAYDEIEKRMRSGGSTSGDLFGSRSSLGDNYLYRMVGAVDGIYGNSQEEAIYPGYLVDAAGEPLDGSRHRYALRFAPDALPPVNAFWSLTLYELPSRLLSANAIDRYLINSAMLPDLRRDPDGGLTLLVQHEAPARTGRATGCPRRMDPSTWDCGCTGQRPKPRTAPGRCHPWSRCPEMPRTARRASSSLATTPRTASAPWL